jgi:serine/threonine protein kinase
MKFYASEIILAIEELHREGIVYRDLKPENILFDKEGHILLTDFGLAKQNITEPAVGAFSLCGTPEYLSPEVLNRTGHGLAVDWWSLGMVCFEMCTGLPPWYNKNISKIFDGIKHGELNFPNELSDEAKSLISVFKLKQFCLNDIFNLII